MSRRCGSGSMCVDGNSMEFQMKLFFVAVSVEATKSTIEFVTLNSNAVHSPVHNIVLRPGIFGRCRLVPNVFCIVSGMTKRQQQCPISVGSLYSYIHLYGDLECCNMHMT